MCTHAASPTSTRDRASSAPSSSLPVVVSTITKPISSLQKNWQVHRDLPAVHRMVWRQIGTSPDLHRRPRRLGPAPEPVLARHPEWQERRRAKVKATGRDIHLA